MYKYIWRYKYLLSVISLVVFSVCLNQLMKANIFFDSERIIKELEAANVDVSVLDDNNLLFFGLSFKDSLSFKDMTDVNAFHKSLKKSKYVKRVFSIINDRQMVNTGLFPITKKVMKLSDEESFTNSITLIKERGNNFLSTAGKKLLFLIENESGLSKEDNRSFVNS